VRPFVIEEVALAEAAEQESSDIEDQMAIQKYLKAKVCNCPNCARRGATNKIFSQVNALIDQANQQWDERNAKALEDGEEELPRMLPLIRLKVRIFHPLLSTH